jgi:hypothetical protein
MFTTDVHIQTRRPMELKILTYKPSSARNSKTQRSKRFSSSIYNREIAEKIRYRRLLLQLYLKNVAKERPSFRLGSQRVTFAAHPKVFLFLALKEFVAHSSPSSHNHTYFHWGHTFFFTIVRTLNNVIAIIRARHYSSLPDLPIICLRWFC